MEEVGEVAMSATERLTPVTRAMTDAVYAALEAIDAYTSTVSSIAEEQAASADPNMKLIKRMEQFRSRAEEMVQIIENEVLDHLNFCNDRLFSIDATERGEFI